MGKTFDCQIEGYEGSVTFKKFGYAEWRDWNRFVNKGHKKSVALLKKSGAKVADEDVAVLTTIWSSSLIIEAWDVCKVDGEERHAIPRPTQETNPENWTYGDDVLLDFALIQWYRKAGSDYITSQVAPPNGMRQGK